YRGDGIWLVFACLFGSTISFVTNYMAGTPIDPDWEIDIVRKYSVPIMIAYILVIAFLTAYVEEIFHRGIILPAVRENFGMYMGVAIATSYYLLNHFYILGGSKYYMINVVVFGFVANLLRIHAQSLKAPYLLHLSHNIASSIWIFNPII
ncbi:MAG: CPBP family intramembrane metalloprotease, partial [Halioglobus sp.]|nr:CPBP family intramembrane metalloprotease [Halioglobus sp.]